jgi:xanthine dehydrogenase small subunit
MKIEFTVNNKDVCLDVPPLRRLLDILRQDLNLTGSKEGCGEGECGACAVLLDERLVNACLIPAMQLPGRKVVTIEGIGDESQPDPVQTAMVEAGAVQCGFCFPGIVMASRSLLDQNQSPRRDEIREALAGNLCRCTGYEKIIEAVENVVAAPGTDTPGRYVTGRDGTPQPVASQITGTENDQDYCIPSNLSEAISYLAAPGEVDAVLAGTTDFLTEMQMGHLEPKRVIDISRLPELLSIEAGDGFVEIGAAVSFSTIVASALIQKSFPALVACAREVGAVAIRNRATLGGNLISASPAADSPPVLMVLDGALKLVSKTGERLIPISAFYTDYRKTVRKPDELLVSIRLPIPAPGSRQRYFKVGTRRAQAISKVALAAQARIDSDGKLADVRLAAGSVAPVTMMLPKTAALLTGADPSVVVEAAVAEAMNEVTPIDDVRSTADYRRHVTGELVRRFILEDLLP